MRDANIKAFRVRKADIMPSSCTQNVLLMLRSLSVRLAPFYTAQDSTELAGRVSAARLGGGGMRLAAALAAVAALAAAMPGVATAEERLYLSKAEIESSLMGKAVVSTNIASGKLSHWEFRSDGTVEAVSLGGLGRAAGTWSIRDDGQTCVKMLTRTGCRYWFRHGSAFANADTNQPDAPIVAEVSYD
jgi:hypothetical protein